MQFVVAGTPASPFVPGPANSYDPALLAALNAVWPAAYAAIQPAPIVPPGKYARIQDTSMTFSPPNNGIGGITLTSGGTGYTSAPRRQHYWWRRHGRYGHGNGGRRRQCDHAYRRRLRLHDPAHGYLHRRRWRRRGCYGHGGRRRRHRHHANQRRERLHVRSHDQFR